MRSTPKPAVVLSLLLPLLAVQLAGCATSPEEQAEMEALFHVKPDPALFPAESAAPAAIRLPMKMALLVPPAISGTSAAIPSMPGTWVLRKKESPTSWRLEAASVVEMAMSKVLGHAVLGEVKSVPSAPLLDDGFNVTLELVSVHFDYDEHLVFLVPLPIPIIGTLVGEFEASMRLTMQLTLFDAQGRRVWAKNYDDGTRKAVWVYPTGAAVHPGDPDWLPGVRRVLHEAAWRLSQQALVDLGAWQAAERVKPRNM